MEQAKFGLEAEYALVRPDGRFADFTNTHYSEVCGLIDPLPDYRHPELRVGDAGIRVKNWYVEGDERFDECGRCTGLAFKGIEIRTAVFPTIEKSVASLRELRSLLVAQLQAQDWSYLTVGFNPYTRSYEPTYMPWERTFQASHIAHHLPEISTLSYGPDLNFSCSSKSPEQVLEIVRRLTYYSPFIVPFSFSSPFVGGALWDGLSYRTYRRTGDRPAALAHLASSHEHPLVKEANSASQHLRVEFKAENEGEGKCRQEHPGRHRESASRSPTYPTYKRRKDDERRWQDPRKRKAVEELSIGHPASANRIVPNERDGRVSSAKRKQPALQPGPEQSQSRWFARSRHGICCGEATVTD